MTRILVLTTAFALTAAIPSMALAQSGAKPVMEIGAEMSGGPGADGEWRALGPRLGVNFNSRTALEVSLSPQLSRDRFSWVDYGLVQVKRSLHAFDRGSLFGTLGVAGSRQQYSDELRGPYPQSYPTQYAFGPVFGFGAELEVAPRLALRAETQYILSQRSLLRFTGGVTMPLGRYVDRSRALDTPELAASPIGRVSLGQTVWVTASDGREIKGEVVSRSLQGLTVRHAMGAVSVAMPEIRKIEITDGLGDGIAVGGVTGGITGGVLGFLGGRAWCEGGADCQVFSSLLIGGLGAGIGTLAGAVVDSFRDTRRPLYDAASRAGKPTIVLSPIVSKDTAGVGGAIRW